ncbi:putative ATP-dependent RNA helicase BoYb [Drosophila sulfurigaster albostrigata]|uniref:putative ATP-dependent RNA helicase BoYb n=1 Tax=Drosophila sulfurigaster albostrigata TaxID=89887 RepID=UPI002D21E8F1|nr:putative ATP-dependent RNA helicase BoYb [Drosophila sulfurigaster albostrigata]
MDCLVHHQQPARDSEHDVLSSQILGGDSVILIDSAKRNFDDYVQPLCQHVREKRNQFITILLVATRKRLLELHHQVAVELDSREFATCCTSNQRATEMLARGHGLVLTTTIQLSAIQSEQLFRSARIGCLVFDELERLLAYGGSCFQAAKLTLYKHYPSMQIVVTTRLWLAEEMGQLLQHAKQPLLLFKDLLEAAAYGGCSWQVQVGNSFEEQLQQLLAYFQTHSPQQQRTLIYCARHEDFLELKKQLSSYDVLLHRGRQDKQRIEQWQRKHAGKILLLQAHAPELQVDNAQSIVHFNMPPTWSQFRMRFAVYKGEIRNALMAADSDQQLRSLVLLDRQSQQSLPQLLEFMQQHGQPIDEQLAKAHSQLVTTREESLIARQAVLCPVMLLYGSCRILPTCQYRHLLSDIDRNCATVPSAGFIRFQLLKICTPSHFAARLVSQRATTKCPWQSLYMPQRYAELQQQLRSHFATTEHRVAVSDVQLQQICVRRMTDNSFERVCITFVPNSSAPDTTVRVKHLDLSTVIHHAKLSELFICPLELQQVQPLALDVRLSGVVPYNGEEIWQNSDNLLISDLLHPGGIYEVHVDYALSQTIFVSCLQLNAQDYAEQLQIRQLGLLDDSIKKRLSELIHDKEG